MKFPRFGGVRRRVVLLRVPRTEIRRNPKKATKFPNKTPSLILSTARIVNVQIDAYDLVLRSAALFKLRPLESPSEKFNVCGPGGMYFGQGGMKTLH